MTPHRGGRTCGLKRLAPLITHDDLHVWRQVAQTRHLVIELLTHLFNLLFRGLKRLRTHGAFFLELCSGSSAPAMGARS